MQSNAGQATLTTLHALSYGFLLLDCFLVTNMCFVTVTTGEPWTRTDNLCIRSPPTNPMAKRRTLVTIPVTLGLHVSSSSHAWWLFHT